MNARSIFGISALLAVATFQTYANAQAKTEPLKKSVTQTSCKDYMEMDVTAKPKFIYYTVGYSKNGKPVSASFDVVDVDKMQPVLDEYCRVNLSASAYEKVMKDSMASEKTNK